VPTDKLRIYNRALSYIGERRLASLTETAETRRALDGEYSDAVMSVLEGGFWNFAVRAIVMAFDPAVTPLFGFRHAYAKPSDWVRTVTIAPDEKFIGYEGWRDENGVWLANDDPIYVRYISSDPLFGLNLARWPESFSDAVASRLAMMICERITHSDTKFDRVMKLHDMNMKRALSLDAMNEPPRRPPTGNWVKARVGAYGYRDR
jgi:hypothetical protein